MITRTVRRQLFALLVITLVGVGYVGIRYAGLGTVFGATTYPVTMQLADSGGIFSGADVTYRGVSVGRVGDLTVTPTGVDVRLDIDRTAPAIPADLHAAVRDLSAIGEQYVDLSPDSTGGPMLGAGSVIPAARTSVPVPVEDLVSSLDGFVRSVPLDSLRTVVDQLGTAFAGTAQPLQQLLDTSNSFTAAAVAALPQTTSLLSDGRTVLTTQNDVAGQFTDFSRNLALLAAQLKTSDPDLRRLIEAGPGAADEVSGLLAESGSGLGQIIADTLTVSRVAEPRQAGLRQLLVTYPGVVASGYTTVPGDGTAHLGLVVNLFDPIVCEQGYGGTPRRPGNDVAETPVNAGAYCAEPPGSPTDVRGAQNVPRAATPKPPPGTTSAGSGQVLPAGSAPDPWRVPLGTPAQILEP
ncbi:MCE family protein [Pseudonocardia benzenivorans]|jgi:phospholipid/cholesterol/gamma-HCH transport system substrate-binding protein|uniref:MCE family protein n=1 Tax=Pseudonocardia benzenivorans TaxID=228005 RepID=A0ABW3VNR6_9PSEU|nr:MlaD family protein [Pseudonocardia dioxanivorans]GJF06812.1 ABC transporter substrate-binding protein [Pseudonocardia sp. D17]